MKLLPVLLVWIFLGHGYFAYCPPDGLLRPCVITHGHHLAA